MLIIYLRTGQAYRASDALTLDAVNAALNANVDRFLEVPLHPDGAGALGSPGQGWDIKNLFITPDSVSHFAVIEPAPPEPVPSG